MFFFNLRYILAVIFWHAFPLVKRVVSTLDLTLVVLSANFTLKQEMYMNKCAISKSQHLNVYQQMCHLKIPAPQCIWTNVSSQNPSTSMYINKCVISKSQHLNVYEQMCHLKIPAPQCIWTNVPSQNPSTSMYMNKCVISKSQHLRTEFCYCCIVIAIVFGTKSKDT